MLLQLPLPKDFEEEIRDEISTNEDMCFYWAILSADWEDNGSEAYLMMIVDMWITIHGFSFYSVIGESST